MTKNNDGKYHQNRPDISTCGAGAGQIRAKDDVDFGRFDITRCEKGDNRANFISTENDSWLLYWWHRLDQEGFVQFTLCVLDKFQSTNSDEFNLVSRNAARSSVSIDSPDIKKVIADNCGQRCHSIGLRYAKT